MQIKEEKSIFITKKKKKSRSDRSLSLVFCCLAGEKTNSIKYISVSTK